MAYTLKKVEKVRRRARVSVNAKAMTRGTTRGAGVWALRWEIVKAPSLSLEVQVVVGLVEIKRAGMDGENRTTVMKMSHLGNLAQGITTCRRIRPTSVRQSLR